MNRIKKSLCLISMPGTEAFVSSVDFYLRKWHKSSGSFIMKSQCARFLTGDAKGLLHESARAKDIFIISDPYNCSVTYDIRGHTNHMSPDDHFMNVKRIISAIDGKARRVSVMMNMLYGSRQDGRNSRESLDCAIGLRELENSGVKNIITFDAHEPKVQNAVPYTSFDNLYPSYQMLKALLRNETGINLSRDETLIVSPDAGGVKRCIHFAKTLGLEIGMFYKQRDTLSTEGGTAPIERHEYIGSDIAGRDVIIVEDIIASGESMINSFYKLKEAGARKIFAFITFGMFTKGYGEFDKAYADGIFNRMFATNLTYRYKDKEDRAYLCDVDLSKYAAYVIDCIYKEKAISDVVDPEAKIRRLMLSSGGRS